MLYGMRLSGLYFMSMLCEYKAEVIIIVIIPEYINNILYIIRLYDPIHVVT